MKLLNQTRHTTIVDQLEVAKTTRSRIKGLLGRAELGQQQGLWIKPCNSIHTWFMKFAIDVVFVDKQLRVKSIYQNVRPWRLVIPGWGAHSVFEIPAGKLASTEIQLGDQLNVVS